MIGRAPALCLLLLCLACPLTGTEQASPVPYLVVLCDPVNSRHPGVHGLLQRDGDALKRDLAKPVEIMHSLVANSRSYPAVLRAAAMRNQVVITAGPMPIPHVSALAEAFPATLFVHIDGRVTAANCVNYRFEQAHVAYLAGLYAGLLCPGRRICLYPWPGPGETELLKALRAGIQRAGAVRGRSLVLARGSEDKGTAPERATLLHVALTDGAVAAWVTDWPKEQVVRLCSFPEKATHALALQIWPDYRLVMERAINGYLARELTPGTVDLDVADCAWRISRGQREGLPASLERVFQSELARLSRGAPVRSTADSGAHQ